MIRPSSTSSPPLRAGFPSHATLSLLSRSRTDAPPVSLRSPYLLSLSRTHTHTHNTRSLHVHHSRHCLLLRAPAPFLLRCLCSPSKLLSSFRCTRDSALEVAGHRPVAEALVLLKAPPPPPLSLSLSAPSTCALLSLNALSFSPSRPAHRTSHLTHPVHSTYFKWLFLFSTQLPTTTSLL